jgi:Bax protein
MFPPPEENGSVTTDHQPAGGAEGSRFTRAMTIARGRWKRVALLGAIAVVAVVGATRHGECADLPDFREIKDIEERKAVFIARIAPMAAKANREIAVLRDRLMTIERGQAGGMAVGPMQRNFVRAAAKRYGLVIEAVPDDVLLDRLLRRVDTVPVSLVVAQAAIESGWGTSRFARHGNNLFGMRTYEGGVGMVPRRRMPGEKFAVATYVNPCAAIRSYIHNLNTHERYQEMREMRERLRKSGLAITGEHLADGLLHYSEKGDEYVGQVKSLISYNELGRFDS